MKRTAFTLVEVVVALALGTLLLLAVQALVVNAYRTSVAIEERLADSARRRLPLDLLEADVQSLPVGAGFNLREGVLEFQTLNALHAQRVAARHTVGVRYELTSDGRLLRREWEAQPEQSTSAAVADDLTTVAFAVFDGQSWHERWPLTTPRSARAVRLKLVWNDGSDAEDAIALKPLTWRPHDE